jgi:hypothetical protein
MQDVTIDCEPPMPYSLGVKLGVLYVINRRYEIAPRDKGSAHEYIMVRVFKKGDSSDHLVVFSHADQDQARPWSCAGIVLNSGLSFELYFFGKSVSIDHYFELLT